MNPEELVVNRLRALRGPNVWRLAPVIAGVVGSSLILSVRNLGYSRNAGEFVKRFFADIGSAGGHRAMAKAVVPIERFRQKFGDLSGRAMTEKIAELAAQFLREAVPEKKREPVAR